MSKGAVLDASAILAVLQDEPGADMVRRHLANAHVSAVNLAEVIAKLVDKGQPPAAAREIVDTLAFTIVPFDEQHALYSAELRIASRKHGLSLGDRACLATAARLGMGAITADRAWTTVGGGVAVVLIR